MSSGASRKKPPSSWSSSAAKMLGVSNLGAANQSTTPCEETSAAVCRSPTSPCSAMGGYRSMSIQSLDGPAPFHYPPGTP